MKRLKLKHNNTIKLKSKMKKLFYVVFAMVAITFAACGNKAQGEATEEGSTADSIAATDTVNVDSALVVEADSTVCPN
jgi:hypothetical protein